MDQKSGPDLCHCHATRRSARVLTRFYDRHLVSAGMSISQFSILSLIDGHPDVKVADLANMMVMERTTLVRAMKPLQHAGWIKSQVLAGRAHCLSLTADGRRKLEEAAPLWEAAQSDFEQTFGRDQAVRLRDANQEIALQA